VSTLVSAPHTVSFTVIFGDMRVYFRWTVTSYLRMIRPMQVLDGSSNSGGGSGWPRQMADCAETRVLDVMVAERPAQQQVNSAALIVVPTPRARIFIGSVMRYLRGMGLEEIEKAVASYCDDMSSSNAGDFDVTFEHRLFDAFLRGAHDDGEANVDLKTGRRCRNMTGIDPYLLRSVTSLQHRSLRWDFYSVHDILSPPFVRFPSADKAGAAPSFDGGMYLGGFHFGNATSQMRYAKDLFSSGQWWGSIS
jgi:hypothetical protein